MLIWLQIRIVSSLTSIFARKIIVSDFRVVPTKQCGAIISISYMSCLLVEHSEKSGGYKVKQGSIPNLHCFVGTTKKVYRDNVWLYLINFFCLLTGNGSYVLTRNDSHVGSVTRRSTALSESYNAMDVPLTFRVL